MSKRKRTAEQDQERKGSRESTQAQTATGRGDERASKKIKAKSGANASDVVAVQAEKDVKQKRKNRNLWTRSDPVGGLLSSIDPIFSANEEHILLAYSNAIRVYARSTSLLVRTLSTGKSTITAFHLCSQSVNQLYVSLNDGRIQLWDWMRGERLKMWDLRSGVATSTSALISPSAKADTLFTADSSQREYRITAHQLLGALEGSKTAYKTLYRHPKRINFLNVLDHARYIVATCDTGLIIGAREDTDSADIKSLKYKFWTFETPGEVTCLDARMSGSASSKNRTKRHLDLVIGLTDGSMHVYYDIVNKLIEVEKQRRTASPSLRLHWHRSNVASVKWSADGNYLISGGLETVLVLWQLDTGGKTFLPHLSAAIQSIVISPDGSSYAICLADNSAMVVSTKEFTPAFNISGTLLPPSFAPEPSDASLSRAKRLRPLRRAPVACLKTSPPRMLLAVSAAMPATGDRASLNAFNLQTIDLRSGTQLAKQALTRSMVTDVNIGPEGHVIDEPNTVLLELSQDGKWMASVEEWMPPAQDLSGNSISSDDALAAQGTHLETSLKFWSWEEESRTWELVMRVDGPHSGARDVPGSEGTVLDLVADGSSDAFITFGDDGNVKVWKPKSRYRGNIPVKDEKGQALVNWSCRQTINLPSCSASLRASAGTAVSMMSSSSDGSLLAVARSYPSESVIYLVDMRQGRIGSTRSNLFTGPLTGLSVLGNHLVLLAATSLVVWDLVKDKLEYALELNESLMAEACLHGSHLAVNHQSNVFAVALPETRARRIDSVKTRVAIFSTSSSECVYATETPGLMLALAPSESQRGFYGLDALAQVHAIMPSNRLEAAKEVASADWEEAEEIEEEEEEGSASQGLEVAIRDKTGLLARPGADGKRLLVAAASEHRPVVRQHQLSELFAYNQPFALPPIGTLFEQVAGLVAGVSVKTQG